MSVPRSDSDSVRLARLRAGDAAAFSELVAELHAPLLRFARTFTMSGALAEDIVQETWLGVIRGLRTFEGRSSLQTWIWSILVRRARTLAAREARRVQLSTAMEHRNGTAETEEWQPGYGRKGLWVESPSPWPFEDPASLLLGQEALEVVEAALVRLPELQKQTVILRDVEGVSASDTCNILQISETNQRVLLHRGRAAIRKALDRYMRESARPAGPETEKGSSASSRTPAAAVAREEQAEK